MSRIQYTAAQDYLATLAPSAMSPEVDAYFDLVNETLASVIDLAHIEAIKENDILDSQVAEDAAAKAARLDITDVCMCSGTDHSWCNLHSTGKPLSFTDLYL